MLKPLLGSLAAATFAVSADAGEVTSFTLPNGLEAVVIEDHRAPVVVQMVWYRAGSADEKPGVSGVAHFLEHLMFKGTDEVPGGEFSKRVEANGGYFRKGTNNKAEVLGKPIHAAGVSGQLSYATGVPISRRIVEQHGGRLEVHDGPDGGACFRVTLPPPPSA